MLVYLLLAGGSHGQPTISSPDPQSPEQKGVPPPGPRESSPGKAEEGGQRRGRRQVFL